MGADFILISAESCDNPRSFYGSRECIIHHRLHRLTQNEFNGLEQQVGTQAQIDGHTLKVEKFQAD